MYHSLSLDSCMTDSSFFPELEEGYHDSFYDEFDEDKIVGSLPLVDPAKYSYLDNVYGSEDSDLELEEGGDFIENASDTEDLEVTEDLSEAIERLSQEMEEETLAQVRQEFNGAKSNRSASSALSICRTHSGRAAKVIMEGEDEGESVGLLQYACGQEEFRRSQSYAPAKLKQKKQAFPTWWLSATPTLKMDKFGNFVVDTNTVDTPVQAQSSGMFAPPATRTRANTGRGTSVSLRNGQVEVQKGRRTSNAVQFEEQTRFECAEPILRQVTKHSNAHKKRVRSCGNASKRIRFASDVQIEFNKIQRQSTKHPRRARLGCGGEVIRSETKQTPVLF